MRTLALSVAAFTAMALAEPITVTDVEAAYTNKVEVKATQELKQSINIGFANTSGNTETTNFNGKYLATFTTTGYMNHPLKVAFDAGFFYDKNNGVLSNEEYTANLGVEQYIMNGWLGYGAINWLRNPDFRNYNHKFAIGLGAGKVLFSDGQQTLKAKLGLAYNIEDFADAQPDRKFGSFNEYLEYTNRLNDVSSLFVRLGSQQNMDDFSNDYEATFVGGFNFAVAENLSVTIEQEVTYDNLPAVGFEKTDTKSIVRIGYNF